MQPFHGKFLLIGFAIVVGQFVMDSYDEVHDVEHSREIQTPPDLDVSSAIKFIKQESYDREDLLDKELKENTVRVLALKEFRTISKLDIYAN